MRVQAPLAAHRKSNLLKKYTLVLFFRNFTNSAHAAILGSDYVRRVQFDATAGSAGRSVKGKGQAGRPSLSREVARLRAGAGEVAQPAIRACGISSAFDIGWSDPS